MGLLARLIGARRGSVAVLGAMSLVPVIGMLGLAVEAGQGYASKIRNQRVADMAALGAALSYNTTSSLGAAQQTARDIVVANGLASSTATVTPDSTSAPTNIQVTVTTPVPVQLARVLGASSSYNVVNAAKATLVGSSSPGCIIALSSTVANGVTETGGTAINATNCAVKTNAGVSLQSSSTTISATEVSMGKTLTGTASWITTSPTANNVKQNQTMPAIDTAGNNAALKAALCQVNKLTGTSDGDYADSNTSCTSVLAIPTAQAASGAASWNLGYNAASTTEPEKYQTAPYQCKYAVPAGTYTIGTLNVPGGCSISFAGPTVLKIDTVTLGGGALLTIGDGTVTVVNTFNPGTSTVTIGNGTHSFGSVSVGGGGKLVVGSGNLSITGKLAVDGGGSNVGFAIGAGESVTIGNDGASTPLAINVSGGAKVCFTAYTTSPDGCASPTAATGGFSANGGITTAGGSTIVFNKASNHVVAGTLALSGSAVFGSGLYVIKGDFTNGTGGSMTGTDVTFALGGTFTLGGGSKLSLLAPSATSGYGVPELLIATKSSSATSFSEGSTGTYSGLIYAPKSNFSLSGGASVASGGACLMMIVNTVTLSGGTTASTVCSTYGASTSAASSVALLQ